jgi:CheY-like chemotaxis protein
MERLARNRGYYYNSCCDGESCVKLFETTLRADSNACNRFDLIIMDKEMPTAHTSGFRVAGVAAVKRMRELAALHAEVEPGFTCPCIIGNSSCTDDSDPTVIEFRNELELARRQAGLPTTMLMLQEKMATWTDDFDDDVRKLCGLKTSATCADFQLPLVWGKPIRLQMLFRNLITNAIQHGKPSSGKHCVRVSYDVIEGRTRMHPCLVRSDQDDEVARSLCWQLSGAVDDGAQQFVQVIVTDNGPGIDANNERMKQRLGQASWQGGGDAPQASNHAATSSTGSVSNFGMCLRRIVCPEIASSHGAMGVHSRIEPTSGCSFVVALPYCDPPPPSSTVP